MPAAARRTAPERATNTDAASPLRTDGLVLRRKCACGGGGAGADGSCEGCRKQKLRRESAGNGAHAAHDTAGPGAETARDGGGVPRLVEEVLATAGSPLDPSARAFAEARFGQDFSQVRVHADARAAESAHAVDALAYTVGNHVVFGAGRYEPSTRGGMRLLAHELAHTVQQRGVAMPGVARLAVGREDDPAEFAADRAADAALAGGPVPSMASSAGTIRRQRVSPVQEVSADEKIVHQKDGTRIRIKRVRWLTEAESLVNWARLSPGIDRKRIWLDIDYCAGQNRGTVRVGANVPEKVLQTIVDVVVNGQDLTSTLKGLDITPFVEVAMLQSRKFDLSASAEITVTQEGEVSGGAGKFKVSIGPVDVEGSLGVKKEDDRTAVEGKGTITVTPGRKTPSQECRRTKTRIVENTRYECEKETDVKEKKEPIVTPVVDEHSRFIYFEYAKDVVEKRSAADIAALTADLGEGFQVTRIRGFTSPEGPKKKEKGNPFIGNEELARKRAAAAAKVAKDSCAASSAEEKDGCFLGGQDAVTPTGEGELYTLTALDAKGEEKEVEGKPLAEHAAGEFVESKDEEVHRTQEMEAKLKDPKTTSKEKADIVYPLLRRAEITLKRTRMVKGTKITPASVEKESVSCPQEVIDQAFPKPVGGLGGG